MKDETNLLIIGAGPFGLSLAAHASELGIEHVVVGKSLEFWTANMPEGMYLRSGSSWHLDASEVHTLQSFLPEQAPDALDVGPLSRQLYVSYMQWFQDAKGIKPVAAYVRALDYVDDVRPRFRATLDNGDSLWARTVVVAVGYRYFRYVPTELARLLPAGRFAHSSDFVDFTGLKGKRCLILGGRQSALEWAALMHEAGAVEVHVSHRHDTPAFAAADWSWVGPLVDNLADNPSWFRLLPHAEQVAVNRRMWAEGRLKVEPWLAPRVLTEGIKLWPNTRLADATKVSGGAVTARLDNGLRLTVDRVILATGYLVQIEQVPFLAHGNVLPRLAALNGFPVLDEQFQTSVPGLFMTSIAANQDFGPFFGFTAGVRASSRILGRALQQMPATSRGR
jgi:cation diffusion facilitator CzcD-associated flavoprotein CzcO